MTPCDDDNNDIYDDVFTPWWFSSCWRCCCRPLFVNRSLFTTWFSGIQDWYHRSLSPNATAYTGWRSPSFHSLVTKIEINCKLAEVRWMYCKYMIHFPFLSIIRWWLVFSMFCTILSVVEDWIMVGDPLKMIYSWCSPLDRGYILSLLGTPMSPRRIKNDGETTVKS